MRGVVVEKFIDHPGAGLGALSQDKLAQDIADFVSLLAKNVVALLRTSGFLSG